MVQGVNCGFVWPPPDFEDHTCTCGDGYVNDEGTLIPGSIIKKGYALGKSEYREHKGCRKCAVDPLKCGWRQQHLKPQNPESTTTAPQNGMFEFFVPGEGISKKVLQTFLQRNNFDDDISLLERRFKARTSGEDGFFVRSSFRFNTQDHRQLKELSRLQHQGDDWESVLQRISRPSSQPFNEFTSYMKPEMTTGFGATRMPTAHHLASAPEQSKESQDQYGRRGADDYDQMRSRHERTSTKFDDDLPQVTSQASRMTVSSRHRQRSPEPTSHGRHSKDIVQNLRNMGENSDEIRQIAPSERRPQDSWVQIKTEKSHVAGQRPESRIRRGQPQQNDSDDEEDAFSRSTAPKERHRSALADEGRYGSVQPHSLRHDPARRSSMYRDHYGNQVTAEAQARSRHISAVTREDEIGNFGREQAWSANNEEDRTDSSSRQRESYSRSNTNYSAATTGYSIPATAYSTSPSAQARILIAEDPTPTQPRHYAHDIPETTKMPNRRASHVAGATSSEPDSGIPRLRHQEATSDDEAHSVQKVKCFFPGTKVDQEVLALYFKHYIDDKACIESRSMNGGDGFLVEAARSVTRDELEDILSDTRSWQREREKGRGSVSYRDSETAKRRKRAGSAK